MPRRRKMDVTMIDTLIALIEERPPIWDKRASSHAKRHTVEKCWREISEALKVDENALRKKWKYLRDQFCVELGKGKLNSSKWRHFGALEFLTETVTPRVYPRNEYSQSEEDDHSSSDTYARNSKEKKKRKEDKKKKKKQKTSIASVPDYVDESNFSNFEKLSEDDDEHLHFFRSVLPHVRRIPGSKVLAFRGHIQSLVEEFAYGVLPAAASSSAFVPDMLSIKASPRYIPEACDPIDTSE